MEIMDTMDSFFFILCTVWTQSLMLQRRAEKADVAYQSPHSFRRYFCSGNAEKWSGGFSLQWLMGHVDIQVLRRYLKQVNQDLIEVHRKASPVDNWR